jgi:acetyl-CoA carboxylase biotin carboxyl carrier protein
MGNRSNDTTISGKGALPFLPRWVGSAPYISEETIVADIKVQSEITGKVWAIEASVGDALEEEDTIIVLESMKMEIPVVAPSDGTLKEILVQEGDAITEGQDVAIMEG